MMTAIVVPYSKEEEEEEEEEEEASPITVLNIIKRK
jgi:hypothetical protein